MNMHVDTLEYANILERAGMARAHAEAIAKLQAKTIVDLLDHELVTKDFHKGETAAQTANFDGKFAVQTANFDAKLAALSADIKGEFAAQTANFDGKLAELKNELKTDMAEMKAELRDEIRQSSNRLEVQLRALQFGGAIAAFVLSAVILMSRFIR